MLSDEYSTQWIVHVQVILHHTKGQVVLQYVNQNCIFLVGTGVGVNPTQKEVTMVSVLNQPTWEEIRQEMMAVGAFNPKPKKITMVSLPNQPSWEQVRQDIMTNEYSPSSVSCSFSVNDTNPVARMKRHIGRSISCSVCDEYFHSEHLLVQHKRQEHVETGYISGYCNFAMCLAVKVTELYEDLTSRHQKYNELVKELPKLRIASARAFLHIVIDMKNLLSEPQ